jgi:hypothetical protein
MSEVNLSLPCPSTLNTHEQKIVTVTPLRTPVHHLSISRYHVLKWSGVLHPYEVRLPRTSKLESGKHSP